MNERIVLKELLANASNIAMKAGLLDLFCLMTPNHFMRFYSVNTFLSNEGSPRVVTYVRYDSVDGIPGTADLLDPTEFKPHMGSFYFIVSEHLKQFAGPPRFRPRVRVHYVGEETPRYYEFREVKASTIVFERIPADERIVTGFIARKPIPNEREVRHRGPRGAAGHQGSRGFGGNANSTTSSTHHFRWSTWT